MKSDGGRGATLGIADLFLVAFVILKLTHVINWSWWWVLSPLWISFGLFVLITAGFFIAEVFESKRK